ncbi:MAG: hypothetical protein HFE75_02485 [Firmicutes bacterium]|nr:hypothetical protein [Bacillota bacterium]
MIRFAAGRSCCAAPDTISDTGTGKWPGTPEPTGSADWKTPDSLVC